LRIEGRASILNRGQGRHGSAQLPVACAIILGKQAANVEVACHQGRRRILYIYTHTQTKAAGES
jgi:hypothetical protein